MTFAQLLSKILALVASIATDSTAVATAQAALDAAKATQTNDAQLLADAQKQLASLLPPEKLLVVDNKDATYTVYEANPNNPLGYDVRAGFGPETVIPAPPAA